MGETNDRAREDAAQGFRIRRLAAERAKLTNPIDRIVFDNQWVDGLPVGLWLMAHKATTLENVEQGQIAALRREAAEAGDLAQVALCDWALRGWADETDDTVPLPELQRIRESLRACVRVIADAEAQS